MSQYLTTSPHPTSGVIIIIIEYSSFVD